MKFYRWVAEHTILAKVLLSLGICTVYTALMYGLELSLWGIVIVDFLLVAITCLWVSVCHMNLWNPVILKNNNECDPYPLLWETDKQMNYRMSEINREQLLLNRCVAKRNLGEYDEVYTTLMGLHLYENPGVLPHQKFVYLNNLFDVCLLLEKYEQADIWYQKLTEAYTQKIKNKKQKELCEDAMQIARAANCFRHGEYEECLSLLGNERSGCLANQISKAMLAANACLKLGQIDRAKTELQFVVQNGNKFYAVVQAQKTLENIEVSQ